MFFFFYFNPLLSFFFGIFSSSSLHLLKCSVIRVFQNFSERSFIRKFFFSIKCDFNIIQIELIILVNIHKVVGKKCGHIIGGEFKVGVDFFLLSFFISFFRMVLNSFAQRLVNFPGLILVGGLWNFLVGRWVNSGGILNIFKEKFIAHARWIFFNKTNNFYQAEN